MHRLLGMVSSSPIGYLAALGVLRVLSIDRGCKVRMGWQDGCPILEGLSSHEAVNEIAANMAGRHKAFEFCWSDTTRKITPDHYRKSCITAKGDQRALGFMAGWGTDTVFRDGFICGTRFDMTSGHQKLLLNLRKIALRISREDLEQAIQGGGTYQAQHSFGLDPVTARTHAHEPLAPTKTLAMSKPGLVWLAFESIPLHPVLPAPGGRAITTGWRGGAARGYVWPIWDGLLSLEEVSMLRVVPLARLVYRPGVKEIWASRYAKSGKYGILLPAVREL